MRAGLAARALRGTLPLVLLGALFVVAGPRELGGPASYVIVSGDSMEPTYRDGDLIIAKERSTYPVGDVITYRPDVGADFPVIHRVVASTSSELVTRGDNRDEDDAWPIAPDDVVGSTWLRVPRGGTVLSVATQPAVLLAVAVFVAVVALVGRSDRRARANEPTEDGAASDADPDRGEPVSATTGPSTRRLVAIAVAVAATAGAATGIVLSTAHAASLQVRAPVLQVGEVERTTPPG